MIKFSIFYYKFLSYYYIMAEKDKTNIIFVKILEFLVKRYNDPIVRSQVPTCIIHPHEYSYTLRNFYYKVQGFNPSTEYHNVFYYYPVKDIVYNTPQNVITEDEKKTLYYTVRLDHRLGYMAVMSLLKVLMLDFDIKDYDVKTKAELKIKACELLKNINIFLKENEEIPLVWYCSETDKGYHFFLMNKIIDYKEESKIYQKFMTLICGDLDYAAFSVYNGFCVRLSKKMDRENDYVAKHSEIKIPNISTDIIIDESSLIYDNIGDLLTIDDEIIKLLNVKYKLIKYFIQFTTKHFEYSLYNYKKEIVNQFIREHIQDVIKNSNDSFNRMKISGEFIKNPSNIIDFIKKTDDFDTTDFTKIDKIVRPDLYETKPIIEELDGGYKMKYLKYKNKYLKMKKIQS